jgi:hypothetical protein
MGKYCFSYGLKHGLLRYIEGPTSASLYELPDDMFDSMGSLTFIHLGLHTA